MTSRLLSKAGLEPSALGVSLGVHEPAGLPVPAAQVQQLVEAALDAGINLLEVGDGGAAGMAREQHGGAEAERLAGAVLRSIPRDRFILCTEIACAASAKLDHGL